jgi:hypothetical protein
MSQQQITRETALHLFAKQASAEGIDLATVTEEQFNQGFDSFVEHILPEMLENGGEPVVDPETPAAPGGEPTVEAKVAAATNALAWNAFLKQASAEDINLAGMPEKDVSELYGHFLLNGVPQLLQQEEVAAKEAQAAAEKRASLEEVTVMGQHFADVAADGILSKLADAGVLKYTPKFASALAQQPETPAPKVASQEDRVEAIAAQRALAAQQPKVASLEDAIAARTQQILAGRR